MLVATLTRIGDGNRPESGLGTITIAPRRPSRIDDHEGRFSVHVTTGPAEERYEQHVELRGAPTHGPAVDLLAHALNVAKAERELAVDGVRAVSIDVEFAAQLARIVHTAVLSGSVDVDDAFLSQLRWLQERTVGASASAGPH